MPIKGWICGPSRLRVPFDHFETCEHGPRHRPAASPFLARLAAIKIAEDVRHQGLNLTATGIMGCPRALYLERTTDYWIDPGKSAVMTRGTALHAQQAITLDPLVWSTEATDPVRHTLEGMIGEFKVSALADAWRRDLTEIVDSKFPKDWSVKFRAKDGKARIENGVQLNIERHLMAQQPWAIAEGFDADRVKLTVWDHGIGATEGPLAQEVAHMTVDQLLSVRPWGSAMTVRDQAALLVQVREEHEKLAPGDTDGQARLAAAIPLVGQPMFNGSKCGMCDLKERCDELVRQFGVPS